MTHYGQHRTLQVQVIIGVAAVIAMLAIGQGAQAVIRAQIASLGSHSLIIQ